MNIALVLNLSILSYLLATDLYTPSMPVIASEFFVTSDEIQASITFFLIGAVITCFIGGLFSNYLGNKRLLLIGLSIALVGLVLAAFASDVNMFLIARFLQGLGGAAAPIIGFSLVQEYYSDEEIVRIYSWMGIMLAGVPAIAPALGGVISVVVGWRYNFWLLFIMTVASWVTVWFGLPNDTEVFQKRSLVRGFKSYVKIATDRQFFSYAILSPLFSAGEWFYITFLPFYFQNQLGLSTQEYGWTIGVLMIWFSVGSIVGGYLTKFYTIDQIVWFSISSGFLSALGLFLACAVAPNTIFLFYIFLVIYMIAYGMLFPTTVAKAMSIFKDMKTSSSSIRFLLITLFALAGGFTAENMDDKNIWNLPIFITIICFISFGSFLWGRLKDDRRS